MRKWFVLIMFLLIPIAFSQEYYADVDIILDEYGYVTIKGDSNHPDLIVDSSPDYTSKKGKYWLLNITIGDVFSDFIFELEMPKNAEINYLKTPRLARIDTSQDHITVTGTGEKQRFVIITQYSFEKPKTSYWFLLIPVAAIILFLLVKFKPKKRKSYNKDVLTKRQKTIFEIIEKNKKITQAELEKKLKMPKSSLSRNIDSLVKKGFITKERKGMTNILFLK